MKADLLNLLMLATAMVLAMIGATWQDTDASPVGEVVHSAEIPAPTATEVTDARGVSVPVGDYQRIVSLNTVADHLLLDLVERDRLAAVTGWTLSGHPDAWRFQGLEGVGSSDQLEQVIGLEPDLVLVSKFADETLMSRLREHGVPVFDLGETRGIETTRANLRTLGVLLGEHERALQIEQAFDRQLEALLLPSDQHVEGLFLTVWGDSFSGGTRGTSYGDMLRYGGVRDLAEQHGYSDWPQYTPEQLIAMNPSLIVTQPDMAPVVCEHGTLRELAACKPGGRVVEVAGGYIGDPGLGVVKAAAAVKAQVHP